MIQILIQNNLKNFDTYFERSKIFKDEILDYIDKHPLKKEFTISFEPHNILLAPDSLYIFITRNNKLFDIHNEVIVKGFFKTLESFLEVSAYNYFLYDRS